MYHGEQLWRYRSLFPGPHLDMVIDSMLAGNTPGRLWVVQEGTAPAVILWDGGNHVFYLAAEDGAHAELDALAGFVSDQILPQARVDGVHRFKVRAVSHWLEGSVPRLFSGITLHPTVAQFSVHDEALPVHAPSPRLPGVSLLPLTRALLHDNRLAGIEYVQEEINGMWPSEARFGAYGFGTLAVLGNKMIGFCTAEFVGPRQCGIGIATAPGHESRGVATAMAVHFVEQARAHGLTPCWECDSSNIASVRVAEKAGFVRQSEERYWIGYFPDIGQ